MSIHTAIGDPWAREIIMEGLREAAEVSGRTVEQLLSHKRDQLTAQARQAVMMHAHDKGVSHAAIGRFFNKDHTTVMHGVRAAKKRAELFADLTPVFVSRYRGQACQN